ncbi:hypothetical protein TWF696_004971 [Orbilia brochopaga]|uniref:Uncharacterized protein n=1 Tax=Orbilia brochopaga TaxID=3140254 RepID=A0AAV9V5W5_9PEZI
MHDQPVCTIVSVPAPRTGQLGTTGVSTRLVGRLSVHLATEHGGQEKKRPSLPSTHPHTTPNAKFTSTSATPSTLRPPAAGGISPRSSSHGPVDIWIYLLACQCQSSCTVPRAFLLFALVSIPFDSTHQSQAQQQRPQSLKERSGIPRQSKEFGRHSRPFLGRMASTEERLYPALPQVITTPPPPATNPITPSTTKDTEARPSESPITPLKDDAPVAISEDLTKSPLPPIPLTATTVTPDPTPRVPTTTSKGDVLTSPVQALGAPAPLLTAAEIATLSPQALREQLTISQTQIATLQRLAEESRAAARHWMLQHKMLESDYTNEKHRFEVEIALAKREVEVLRGYDSRRTAPGGTTGTTAATNILSANNSFNADEDLSASNEKLRERLNRAKNLILEERAAKKDLEEMVERLKKRIRDNRRHDNMVDRAILHVEASRGLKRSESGMSTTSQPREDGLAALGEVASQVLMEQEARAGGTPKKAMQTSRPGDLVSPIELGATVATATPSKKRRRRKSRDSTISASDGEAPTVVNTPARKVQRKEAGALAASGSPGTPKKARAGTGSAAGTPRSVKKKLSGSWKATNARSPLVGAVVEAALEPREKFGAALNYTTEGGGGT